jgi:hypothetical protein
MLLNLTKTCEFLVASQSSESPAIIVNDVVVDMMVDMMGLWFVDSDVS